MPVLSTKLSIRFRRWLAAWREAAARRREPEGDALERDTSSVDFRLARVAALAEFEQMAPHFGVDPTRCRPTSGHASDAERICALCQDVRRCRRWLAQEAKTDAPRLFCANAPVFDQIASSEVSRRWSGARS